MMNTKTLILKKIKKILKTASKTIKEIINVKSISDASRNSLLIGEK